MVEKADFKNVAELYETGEWVLQVVMQFKDPSDVRAYRLFAKRWVNKPQGIQNEMFTVDIDRLRTFDIRSQSHSLWVRLILPGVIEGKTADDALRHAVSALDSLADGSLHDEQGAGSIKVA